MNIHPPRTRRGRARHLAVAATAALALAGAAVADAATVTKNSFAQGIPGFPGAPGGLGVFEPGTPFPPPDAVREVGTYDVTVAADPAIPAEAPFAGTFHAYAVTDIRYHTDNGIGYPMLLQTAPAFAGEFTPDVAARLTWLLRNGDGLAAGEADHARAAAAVQIAVWQTLRNPPQLLPRADLNHPSDDDAVNALAAKFLAQMEASLAAKDAAVAVATVPNGACGATLTVTGTPGSALTLTATGGGILSAAGVVLDQNGVATVTVTAPPGATVTVTAHAMSGGELVRADGAHDPDPELHPAFFPPLTKAPEELIFLGGAAEVTASTQVSCPGPPNPAGQPGAGGTTIGISGTPSAPGGVSTALRVVKTGPLTAVAGQVVTYRIRVTNTGAGNLTGVVLRDVLPGAFTVLRTPSGATVTKRVVTWSVGVLAAGAKQTVTVRVRIARTATGTRCNRATAAAAGVATARATACTAVRAVAGAGRIPSVTG